jgi:hypothetical protein
MRKPWIIVAFALISASAFALSVQSGRWWSVGEVAIGPFGTRHCFDGECRASGLAWLGGSDLWMRSAVATGVAGLVTSFLLVVIAGALAARRVPRLAARSSLAALATALAVGGYFVARFPRGDVASIDRGVVLFVVGIVFGIPAAIAVLRSAKPS